MDRFIYLDNAATSFPKPAVVTRAMVEFLERSGANPGRSGHRLSAQAARIVHEGRLAVAGLLGVRDARQLIFTANATASLNLALNGFLRPGDHVVTTSLEHNSVMRPLRRLREQRGVAVTLARADGRGVLDPQVVREALRPATRLVVVTHASNVTGAVVPLAEIRAAIGDLPLLVDGAQTVGALPIDVNAPRIDLLAFSGHKSLLGPPGIGCLYVGPELALEPLVVGGTGSGSESDAQPEVLPDLLESGTPNGVGIAGLGAAVRLLAEAGLPEIAGHKERLLDSLLCGLGEIEGVRIHGPGTARAIPGAATEAAAGAAATRGGARVPIVSLTVRNLTVSDLAYRLDRRYGILARAGLHCAPQAHRTIGTFPEGTLRLSPGYLNTADEIALTLAALRELAAEALAGGERP